MIGPLLLIIAAAAHVLCLGPLMCKSSPVVLAMDDSEQNQQQQQLDQLDQEQYACLLRSNESLVEKFQQSVRERHGISDPSYGIIIMWMIMKSGNNIWVIAGEQYIITASDWNVRCRASCPSGGGNVIWCVNTYHPMKNIEACFSEGKLINATDAALSLGIQKFFETPVSSNSINHRA
jgi:hypothetical protein